LSVDLPVRSRSVLSWLAERHSLPGELVAVVVLYGLYETGRGLVGGDTGTAVRHARSVASLERTLRVFGEIHVQHAAAAVPGLIGTLGVLYLTVHLLGTGLCLLWFHRRRPEAFPAVRTALLAASSLGLIGFLAFPTAPPRLAALGIGDSVSQDNLDLNHGFICVLYNPYAAVPSMHVCYATVVGASLFAYGERRSLRALGVLYPVLQLFVVVATGNHFFFDAATGAAVAAISVFAGAAVSSWARAPRDGVAAGAAGARVRLAAPGKAWSPYAAPSPRRPLSER
jgi:hypothetical protein